MKRSEVLMEGFVWFVVILGIWLLWGWLSSRGGTRTVRRQPRRGADDLLLGTRGGDVDDLLRRLQHISQNSFAISVSPKDEQFAGHTFRAFEVCGGGLIVSPAPNYPVRFRLALDDITNGPDSPQPVLCVLPDLQIQGTTVFGVLSPVSRLPYEQSVLPHGTELMVVPIDVLLFPSRGQRGLQFVLSVIAEAGEAVLASAKCVLDYVNPELGYVDFKNNAERADTLAVKLGIAVSAADGTCDLSEADVVKDWMRTKIDQAPADERDHVRQRLNGAAREASRALKAGQTLDVVDICRELLELTPVAKRYEIFGLCVQVAAADQSAKAAELDVVETIANSLHLNRERFRTMMSKGLPVSMHKVRDVQDVNRLLGITPDMTAEERKVHLRREYQRWNARVTHSDPKVRQQANQMLELIAQARSRVEDDS